MIASRVFLGLAAVLLLPFRAGAESSVSASASSGVGTPEEMRKAREEWRKQHQQVVQRIDVDVTVENARGGQTAGGIGNGGTIYVKGMILHTFDNDQNVDDDPEPDNETVKQGATNDITSTELDHRAQRKEELLRKSGKASATSRSPRNRSPALPAGIF
jgi:type II secretory pathway predicted ATPase ExeA